MIKDHPDLQWCEHHNVHEISIIGRDHPNYYICENCGDIFPIIGDTDQWAPKLIGPKAKA